MEWLTGGLAVIKAILGFGDTVRDITKAITEKQIAQIQAGTDERKAEIAAELEALKARRDVLIAETPGSRVNMLIRVLLSIPAVLFLWKVIVIDKLLGLGTTDDLSGQLWWYVQGVVGFYLLARVVQVSK